MVAAVIAAGAGVAFERVWSGVHRSLERRLKNVHDTPRLCLRCVSEGLTGGCGLLGPAPCQTAAHR